jgi:hypothetical protein
MSEIQIPYQSEDQPISEAIAARVTQVLEGADRLVADNILFDALGEHETMGQVLDSVSRLGPEGRRALLDRARVASGLPTLDQEHDRRAYEEANAAVCRRAPGGDRR